MSTMQQQAPTAEAGAVSDVQDMSAAVEEQMGKIVTELGALLERGDPAGRDELLVYITLAGNLGHARGRWGALTRQATFAQLAGRAEESARLGEQALELGLAIGEPDAIGCFFTSRSALAAFGVDAPSIEMDAADPLWPMFPVLRAWPFAARGEAAAAASVLGDFSVLDIATWTGLEALAATAVVFAVTGSDAQPRWPCTSGWEPPGWARLSEQALARLQVAAPDQAASELRLENGVRLLCFGASRSGCPTPRAWPTSRR